jgi:starch-binding outer membrane protein, SusD/RagB family
MTHRHRFSGARLAGSALLFCVLAGCDASVTNPGPLGDDDLNTPSAIPALVNGMSGDLSLALGNFIDRGALASGELTEAGNFAAEQHYYQGVIRPEDVNADWANMQTARWTTESGLRRMQDVLGAGFEANTSTPRAYLYAGFANRLLGENACVAVIDGGAPQSDSVYFQRADSLFTRAVTLATAQNNTNVKNAALAGRASVRAWLGDWANAVIDATQVPDNFVFNAIFSTNTPRENNDLANQTITRRETTVFGTVYALTKADPRTTWDTVKTTAGKVQTGQDGKTPFFRQTKYTSLGSPVPLAKGTEMLLIRAENALRANDVAGAMTLINQERALFSLSPLTAATTAVATMILHMERGSVLWLEGRRLWDLRRWNVAGTDSSLNGRDKCIPPSANEQAANPNF